MEWTKKIKGNLFQAYSTVKTMLTYIYFIYSYFILCIFVNKKKLMRKSFIPIRLREARKMCGYSLDQFVKAAKIHVTRQSIYNYSSFGFRFQAVIA